MLRDRGDFAAREEASTNMTQAFFEPLGEGRYRSTEHTLGPWGGGSQHGGPPSALLGRALELHDARDDLLVVRFTAEILRPVPQADVVVGTRTVRGGRNVELLEAVLAGADGAELIRASAWRMRPQHGGFAAGDAGPAMAGPERGVAHPFFDVGLDVGYHTAMEWRFLEGAFMEPGPAKVWLRMRVPLVPDEQPSPLQRVLCAADSGNGVSATADARTLLFVNTDLSVHLRRPPRGEWIGMDARTVIEPDGVGLAETVLHDIDGPIGRGAQALYVAPR